MGATDSKGLLPKAVLRRDAYGENCREDTQVKDGGRLKGKSTITSERRAGWLAASVTLGSRVDLAHVHKKPSLSPLCGASVSSEGSHSCSRDPFSLCSSQLIFPFLGFPLLSSIFIPEGHDRISEGYFLV